MGQVSPPELLPVTRPIDHAINAFLEFLAITKASRDVKLQTCAKIMQTFRQGNKGLLKVLIEEAEAAIYDSDNSRVIEGKMSDSYMVAYSASGGFVEQNEEETERAGHIKFKTPVADPLVVVAKCTIIMPDDKILKMGETISGSRKADWNHWKLPHFEWINGVPGCGKTTWVVKNFNVNEDIVITSTIEAANDLKEKLAHRIGDLAKTKVRTMASVLVNGFRGKCHRLTIDEALMNHFGAIVMASQLAGAGEIVLIGDINQLPFIDRDNLFDIQYNRPNLVTNITKELLLTHRNPMDVAYALQDVYSGIYSSKRKVQSLKLAAYTGAEIPRSLPNTLFLVHTQEEKKTLTNQGFGAGDGSRTLTVHEAQGLSYETVIIINTRSRIGLHDSVPHAVVAISRHTGGCIYYTDDTDDAIGNFIKRATAVPAKEIVNYNFKMAIKDRNAAVWNTLEKVTAEMDG